MVLSWKEKEDTKASAKKASAKPAPRKKGKEPDHHQPVPNYRNLYEDIEDADDPSEAEVLKDVVDDADMSEPTTYRIPQVGTSRSAGTTDRSTALQTELVSVAEDEHVTRLGRLKEARLLVGASIWRV